MELEEKEVTLSENFRDSETSPSCTVGEEDGDRRSLLFGDWSRIPYGVHFAIEQGQNCVVQITALCVPHAQGAMTHLP